MQTFDRIRRSCRSPLALGQSGEGEQPIAGFLEAVGDTAAFQAPFGEEQPSLAHHLGIGIGVDHVVVVGRDLLVQRLGSVREQISMLVDCMA